MPINLDSPLAWTRATPQEVRMLDQLQGNILKGHGRDFVSLLFFRFDRTRRDDARTMLRRLAAQYLTSAHAQLRDTEAHKNGGDSSLPFVHLALSFQGYEALGLADRAPLDADFRLGMRSDDSRDALADPVLAEWQAPFQQDLHGVVLVAKNSEAGTSALEGVLTDVLGEGGASVLHVQRGKGLKNDDKIGIEHFGYVDGTSQPLMLKEDIEAKLLEEGNANWDPAAPLSTALLADPGVDDDDTSFGSFLVFRKLEQHVRGFKRREQEIADALGLQGEQRELAGALLVGRFENGTPVTWSRTPMAVAPPNNFDFATDPGSRCPFHAHIRKTNPRGSGGFEAPAPERAHLMARRGIPFEDRPRDVHPEQVPDVRSLAEFDAIASPLLPEGDVGLLFMAYNRDIGEQFRFTQQSWANNVNFPNQPTPPHGLDPLIGQGALVPGQQRVKAQWNEPDSADLRNVDMAGFIRMQGGEYFFAPSLRFLKRV